MPPLSAAVPALFCTDTGLRLLSFTGPDTDTFLQGQLSNDVKALAAGGVQLSSYNSPKGRMLATLTLWRDGPDTVRALVAADVAEPLRRRLAMFVLRAKVSVTDPRAAGALIGIAGPGAADAVRATLAEPPAAGCVTVTAAATVVALPGQRYVVVAPIAESAALAAKLAPLAAPASQEDWRRLGILAGVPSVGAATQDLFVPQTANWDVLGGLSFHKGCYTGQEIIARTQYLGRLKERMHLFHTDAPPPPAGTKVYGGVFGDQACGTVVDAATAPGGGCDLLAVVQLAALDGALHAGAPDGPLLAPLALPYALPAPAAPNRPKL